MRIDVFLPRAQWRRLKKGLRKTPSRIEALGCRVLRLLHERRSVSEVATWVGGVGATVYRTVYRYEERGEASVIDQRTRREAEKMTLDLQAHLLSYLDDVPQDDGWQRSTWTRERLALPLEQEFEGVVSCSTVQRALRNPRCRRGWPRPGLRIPVRGRRKVLEKSAARVASASAQDEGFYQDEADVHRNPKMGATYLKHGQQSIVLTPGKNVKRYLFGALNARTGRSVSGVVEHKNAALFVEFLQYLSAPSRRASRLHRVLDNDILHQADVVRRYLASINNRVVLHFLPPYLPDDNVIARLCKQMHPHVTRNHRHKHLDTWVEAVHGFLHSPQPFPGTNVSTLRLDA